AVLPLAMLYPFYGHAPCGVGTRVRALRNGTELLDANGRRLGFVDQNRERFVALSTLPKHVPLAFVAVEDRRLHSWYHRGIDPVGTVAAAFANLTPGDGPRRGASTIPMQLARALCGDRMPLDHSWSGKLAEAGLGVYLTSRFGKREVLELYLNSVYLGRNRNGVEAAARSYYGKSAAALTPSDAAELAHLVAMPRERDPAQNAVPQRRAAITSVFSRMHRMDTTFTVSRRRIAPSRARTSSALPVMYRGYVSRVRDGFSQCEPSVNCPTSVRTFLDADLQRSAERELSALVRRLQGPQRTPRAGDRTPAREVAGIFVAMRVSTGEIVSYTGRHGRTLAGADLLRIGRIQPASAIKPLLLAAALDDGEVYSDETLGELMDNYCPAPEVRSYLATLSGSDAPERTVSEAMLRSDNVLGACLMAGLSKPAKQRLTAAGILRSVNTVPADGLGLQTVAPLDLLTAYAAMRTRDRALLPRFSGYDAASIAAPLMTPMSAEVTYTLLRDVAHQGTAWRAASVLGDDYALAGKTGTAGKGRELVFVGFARDLVALLWVGVVSGNGAVSQQHASDVVVEPWARILRSYAPRDDWSDQSDEGNGWQEVDDEDDDSEHERDMRREREAARDARELQQRAEDLRRWITRMARRVERRTL
ncbi:MAG TPA: transglycosylase domain-containing protein, partial [Gemmatimonadaceae bacterium]|nr:transglycosylase domain-containing protein [Gemmatimonadaceae bacterium]